MGTVRWVDVTGWCKTPEDGSTHRAWGRPSHRFGIDQYRLWSIGQLEMAMGWGRGRVSLPWGADKAVGPPVVKGYSEWHEGERHWEQAESLLWRQKYNFNIISITIPPFVNYTIINTIALKLLNLKHNILNQSLWAPMGPPETHTKHVATPSRTGQHRRSAEKVMAPPVTAEALRWHRPQSC